MGSTFSQSWPTVAAVKAMIREEFYADQGVEVLAEASGSIGDGETGFYVAHRLKEDYYLPAGSVVADVFILYGPKGGYGAGYKPMSEFSGPYFANGVTVAFLSALTPLPPVADDEPRDKDGKPDGGLAWARAWRSRAAAEAKRTFLGKQVAKSLKVGDRFTIPNVAPSGPFTLTHLIHPNKRGSVLAQYQGVAIRIPKRLLTRAIIEPASAVGSYTTEAQ